MLDIVFLPSLVTSTFKSLQQYHQTLENSLRSEKARDLERRYEELKRLNLQIDSKLVMGSEFRLTDLCARRKAYQDILDAILSAKRQVQSNNPADRGSFDLDAVTAEPG